MGRIQAILKSFYDTFTARAGMPVLEKIKKILPHSVLWPLTIKQGKTEQVIP